GRDGGHRAALELPADDAFTWRQGLDRLLLGFAAPPQLAGDGLPLLGDSLPLDALEGARAQLLGRLCAFVEQLAGLAERLQRARPLADWALDLQAVIDALFDEREAGDTLLLLSQACAALGRQAQDAGIARPVELALVRQQLGAALESGSGASGFLTGAVTFCTMVPMRSLPFRQVCLLGLDDGALPRRAPAAGFDLIARKPRRGDRARRLDDRYLLLEVILSARDGLYLSHVGRDPRDNKPLPPSVLVSELLEALDVTATAPPSAQNIKDLVSQTITCLHPLQPFAPGNFDRRQGGFAGAWFRAAQRLAQSPQAAEAPFAQALGEPDEEALLIEPSQLIKCFRHPARYLLEQRLGLRLAESEEALASDEPFTVERSTQHGLRQLALQAIERGWSERDERRVASAAGWLPV